MTPFQRMVILKEAKRQQDEAEKEAEQPQGSGFGNSAASPNQTTHTVSGETIEYVNENA